MPRIALISDIHANAEALGAVLRDAEIARADLFVCLGDVVGYGPDPDLCLDLVAQHCIVSILGNHDEAILRPELALAFNERAQESVAFTRSRLTSGHLMLIGSMRRTALVAGVSLSHGSFGPNRYEYLTTPGAALRALRGLRTPVGCVGHTHVPGAFILTADPDDPNDPHRPSDPHRPNDPHRLDNPDARGATLESVTVPEGAELVIPPGARAPRVVLNPGSVGQPRDRDHRAAWGLLDTDRRTFSVRRVAYDIDSVHRKIERSGLPDHLAQRLKIGA